MRIYHIPMGIYRCNAQDNTWKLRSFRTSRTKRQVNAFILCRDTKPYPQSFSAQKPLKRSSMHRYGVSESGIACKGNEKIDYPYLFHGFFLAVRIKNWCLGTQRRLIAPKHTILLVFLLEFQISFSKCFVDSCNKFLWLEIFHLRKGKPFFT